MTDWLHGAAGRLAVLLADSSLPWLTLTLLVYLAAVWLYHKSGNSPYLIPVLPSVVVVVAVLLLTGTPYPVYFDHVQALYFLIGPATVALAVPLYGQLHSIRTMWRPLGAALLVGSSAAIVSAVLVAWALGGSLETILSLAPKSASMPFALPVAERLGGLASLAAVAVAITGILGAVVGRPVLNALGIENHAVRGFAVGLTAHAIGTARALQVSETAGAFSALAMGLNGIATAVLVPLFIALLQWLGML
ncbi:MAG: LrgB family protein [Giesbergeria sp.]|nr:LrgB family protein [Giesbergeria sp.]